ncbi:Pc12g07980 [Penicillium rubens Wisconsin 54-1255]|uniref:Pc12g07980 protein n=1 Tax=Penicillium rubens (strain ATCC 28089 / DSM 1075 / NRRL 1951 / Wisconsin 54-1255) TaxID=500485 RepID=B6GXM9_PENRW|nr:Pc12g07980 [Penicillium rubens Wisconsin 54-1255]
MKSTNTVPQKRKKQESDDEDDIVKDGTLTSAAENFFEALSEAGITHCFVNLGSDHPAMLEAMIKARQENNLNFPNIITCPSELVALSAALGYAQATGVPQCVIVHVDCGTLAMGQSIHNASVSRVPVLCFAGLSPFTQNGELLGSRTEFIHWLQDVPDQAAIVRQYCRYTGEIKTGRNIKQMVSRALQFATSDPKGPAYLMAAREVLEEVSIRNHRNTLKLLLTKSTIQRVGTESLDGDILSPIAPSALPEQEVELIAKSLMDAKRPLVITSYLGRNLKAPALLAELCDKLPITVVEMVGSDVCLRSDHEAYRGVTVTTHPEVLEADVILILDCDVPWIPTAGKPRTGTKVFHLDVDPLKQQMPRTFTIRPYDCLFPVSLIIRYQYSRSTPLADSRYTLEFEERSKHYKTWRETLRTLESPSEDGVVSVPYLASRLRDCLPQDTIYVLEAVTNAGHLIHHLNLTKPGSLVASGAGGLGWGGGAALGVKLGKPGSFVCGIVGDGVYLFSQMESVYWIARRYDIPFLLVVLNNGGWNAPKVSALLVHREGLSSKSNRRDLNISFDPSPDYPGIAAAAGKAWGATVTTQSELDPAIKEATNVVQGGKCAVVEVSVPSMWKEN